MPASMSLVNRHEAELVARQAMGLALSSPKYIRTAYGDMPIELLRILDGEIKMPAKLKLIFLCLWLEQDENGKRSRRFIIKGPRGGGKSKLLGAIGFVKWYLQLRKIVDMGGSLAQAQGVYNYFAAHCYASDTIIKGMPDEPTLNKSVTEHGNYFRAVAASPKAVRGPHPDNLFIDEACEVKDELILAALPMVNTSQNSMIVLTSTFHKIYGYFQETWDRAPEMGYTRFSWDMFDVMQPFDPLIWSMPNLLREIPDLSIEQAGDKSLEARAAGRTGDPDGWVPIDNVIQAWREKTTIDWFDVEYMGSRPNAVGMVNDPADVDACLFNPKPFPDAYKYIPGLDSAGGIDWGFSSMTAMVGMHKAKDDVKVKHFQRTYTAVRSSIIIEDAIECIKKYGWKAIYCDSAGKFENADLRAAIAQEFNGTSIRCIVIEVNFGTEKTWILGNYRTHFARHLVRIPDSDDFKVGIWQHKRYRYQEGSDKPLKQDDHIPDATMCVLSRWPIGKRQERLPRINNDEKAQRGIHTATITGSMLEETF